jgi:transposase InsO family protein
VLTVARRRVKRRRPWLRRRPPSALMGIFQGEFLGGLWWFTIRGFIRWLSNGKYPVMVTYPVMVYGLNHQISMGFMVISNFRWLQAIEDMFNRQIWGYSQEI